MWSWNVPLCLCNCIILQRSLCVISLQCSDSRHNVPEGQACAAVECESPSAAHAALALPPPPNPHDPAPVLCPQVYLDMAAKDKARYVREMAEGESAAAAPCEPAAQQPGFGSLGSRSYPEAAPKLVGSCFKGGTSSVVGAAVDTRAAASMGDEKEDEKRGKRLTTEWDAPVGESSPAGEGGKESGMQHTGHVADEPLASAAMQSACAALGAGIAAPGAVAIAPPAANSDTAADSAAAAVGAAAAAPGAAAVKGGKKKGSKRRSEHVADEEQPQAALEPEHRAAAGKLPKKARKLRQAQPPGDEAEKGVLHMAAPRGAATTGAGADALCCLIFPHLDVKP